jgi:hypothetical protein
MDTGAFRFQSHSGRKRCQGSQASFTMEVSIVAKISPRGRSHSLIIDSRFPLSGIRHCRDIYLFSEGVGTRALSMILTKSAHSHNLFNGLPNARSTSSCSLRRGYHLGKPYLTPCVQRGVPCRDLSAADIDMALTYM